ncbi:NUDIX domain-containing protein [Chondromyces crocatus]|uniref:NUDIX hydrolase n=1 Tax=Chondromyces crocatus TaxID=52 RepID=A0A0K1EID9_CHOCO|nr:NUDIX domain-containing protein [Chondromyces crocatus]AKT40620.1 NUDIX hydrolase [Chondromyces crocatus]
MSRSAVAAWCFAVIVVKLGRRFLVVRERKHGQLWYLPAGRVEAGESFADAALRETLEEGGIPIELEGILRVEHSPQGDEARFRVIFLARPAGDALPKQTPDEHSLEARWVTVEELSALPQRGPDVARLFREVLGGAPVYPLSLVRPEGEPLLP